MKFFSLAMRDKNIKVIIIVKHLCFPGSYCFAISQNDHCVGGIHSLTNHSQLSTYKTARGRDMMFISFNGGSTYDCVEIKKKQ